MMDDNNRGGTKMRQVTITINVESIIVERDGSFAIDKYSSEANDIVYYEL